MFLQIGCPYIASRCSLGWPNFSSHPRLLFGRQHVTYNSLSQPEAHGMSGLITRARRIRDNLLSLLSWLVPAVIRPYLPSFVVFVALLQRLHLAVFFFRYCSLGYLLVLVVSTSHFCFSLFISGANFLLYRSALPGFVWCLKRHLLLPERTTAF